MVKVLVCGGRDFNDTEKIYQFLDRFHRFNNVSCLVEGDARGVDRIAGYWARKNKINNEKYPALWDTHGRKAGVLRNQMMLDYENPDIVIAFPGGRGTTDMVERARKQGFEVYEVSKLDMK